MTLFYSRVTKLCSAGKKGHNGLLSGQTGTFQLEFNQKKISTNAYSFEKNVKVYTGVGRPFVVPYTADEERRLLPILRQLIRYCDTI